MGAELKMLEKGSEEYNAKLIEIEEARTKIREDAAEKQKVIDDKKAEEKKKADEKEKERIKKEKDDALANNIAQQDLVEEQLQAIENAENEYYKNKKTARQQDLDDVNNKYFQLIETAKQNNIDTNILLEAQLKEEQIIKDKYKKDALEKEGQALYNYYQGVIKTNKQIRDDDKLTADAKFNTVKNSLNVIGDLATSFAGKSEAQQKKAFEIQKAANIAGAVIDSIRATMGAWKSGNVIGGPVLGGIQAGLAAASGAIMIRKLEQQTFKGKGDTTAPMPSANGGGQANQVITPNFNIIGAQNQTQLAQLNQAPIKAYVVGSDVTTQQMLDKKKIQNATL